MNGVVRSQENNGSFEYPVGDGTHYRPIQANITANATGLDAKYIPGDAGAAPFTIGGTAGSELLQAYYSGEYWQVKPVSTTSASLTINYAGPLIGNTADLRVAHRVDNGGGQWWNEGGTPSGTTASGSVTSNPLTSAAMWDVTSTGWATVTLGSINKTTSPLPVTIISITATKQGSAAQLNWQVAQEQNLAGYAIERSCDGISYQRIGYTAASGSSNYSYTDKSVPCSKVYYRLRLEDLNSQYSYSKTVSLSFSQDADQPITVAPNPVTDHYSINIPAGNPGHYSIMLYSRAGQRISQTTQLAGSAATTVTLQRADGIARGIYVLEVYNENTGAKKVVQLVFY